MQQSTKDVLKEGYSAVLRGTGAGRAWRAARGNQWGAAVLNYHWIEPEVFQSHLLSLSRDFTIVSLDRVMDYLDGVNDIPPGAVALTFDDGYAAFKRDVWPIVRNSGIPITMFVATHSIDTGRTLWFDRLRAAVTAAPTGPFRMGSIQVNIGGDRRAAYRALMLRLHESRDPADDRALLEFLESAPLDPAVEEKYRPMSWTDLRDMSEFVRVGAHTASHPNLAKCGADATRLEIETSLHRINDELGQGVTTLAYPFGQPQQVNDAVTEAARAACVRHAFTTIRGRVRRGDDSLRLSRFVCDDVPNGRVLSGLLGGLWRSVAKEPEFLHKRQPEGVAFAGAETLD